MTHRKIRRVFHQVLYRPPPPPPLVRVTRLELYQPPLRKTRPAHYLAPYRFRIWMKLRRVKSDRMLWLARQRELRRASDYRVTFHDARQNHHRAPFRLPTAVFLPFRSLPVSYTHLTLPTSDLV